MGKPATVSPPYQPVAFQFCARLEPKPCTSTMVGWLVSSDGDSRSKASATPSDAVVNWGMTWLPSNLSELSIRPNSQSPPRLSIKAGHEKISVPGRYQWRDRGGRGRPCVPCAQSALGSRGHRPAGRHLSPGPCGGAGPGGAARPRAEAAGWLFLAGMILFCGGLYLLALTDAHIFAYLVPFGGLSFIAGWIALALAALKLEDLS